MDRTEGARSAFRIGIRFVLSVILVLSFVLVVVSVMDADDSDAESGRLISKGDYTYVVISEKEYLVELKSVTKPSGLVSVPATIKDDEVPFTVIGIGDKACYNNAGVNGLSVASTVTYIGDYAFSGCSKINKITGMTNVSTIGEHAFEGCISVEKIYLFSDVVTIEPYAFSGCSALKEITLPSTVKRIEEYAFNKCLMLPEIALPKGLESIGDYAFRGCRAIESMIIPENVTNVGAGVFSECTKLIYVSLPRSIIEIKNELFSECTTLYKVDMSEDVEWIGSYAFNDCINLSTITISSKVGLIGSFAFYGITFYNFEETQTITDDSDLPGYTYVLKEPGIMIRQEIYAVHYDPNGGPNLADDEPHVAGQYFIPTKIESGVLVCEDWIYDGKIYHYGEKILMPGEDITLVCKWTQAVNQNKDEPKNSSSGNSMMNYVGLAIVGIMTVAVAAVGIYVLTRRQ